MTALADEDENKLVLLNSIENRLATIQTIDEAKDVRDQAEALRRYAKSAKRGLAVQNRVAKIKILAEHRAGELLKEIPRVQGNRNGADGLRSTLEQSGISPSTAQNWQIISELPVDRIVELEAEKTNAGEELTSIGVLRIAAQTRRRTYVPFDDFGDETTPVAAAIIGNCGGLLSETGAKANGKYDRNPDLWDDKPVLAHPTHNKIYSSGNGQMPDSVASELYDMGVIHDASVTCLYDAIERESRTAQSVAREQRAHTMLDVAAAEISRLETQEVESFVEFLKTKPKRDAALILTILAVRLGCQTRRLKYGFVQTCIDRKQTRSPSSSLSERVT